MTAKGHGASLGGGKNVIKLIVVIVAQLGEYTILRDHWIVRVKYGSQMVCELYLSKATIIKKKKKKLGFPGKVEFFQSASEFIMVTQSSQWGTIQ